MAEGGGLENRCTREGTVGSNPTSSANLRAFCSVPIFPTVVKTVGSIEALQFLYRFFFVF